MIHPQERLVGSLLALNASGELLVVVWTERDGGERLISVRRATAKKRKDYES